VGKSQFVVADEKDELSPQLIVNNFTKLLFSRQKL
jgi:hypothetical protein